MTDVHARQPLLDVTGCVPLGDESAVADAVARILDETFGATSFATVGRMFAGAHPGCLACDMPYHDLRHSLDTALAMARLVAGWQAGHAGTPAAFTPDLGLLAVLLGLLHDSGYLRTPADAALCGPRLAARHEARSVEFAAAYLDTTSLAGYAPLASLILATQLGADLDRLFAGHDRVAIALGRMLGSADLLCQVADPWYPERCYYHLYPELVLGGGDRVRTADGGEQTIFGSALDLLRKTPGFVDGVVCRRLDQDLHDVARHLARHFAGNDPYADAMRRNRDRLRQVTADGGLALLQGVPATTTANLAPIYLSPPA